jgi:SAM-dependent methyltransferase
MSSTHSGQVPTPRGPSSPGRLQLGGSTARTFTLAHRLDKLEQCGLLHGRFLDCGCADGGYTVGVAQRGVPHPVGVEFDVRRMRSVRQSAAGLASFAGAVAEALPFPAATFDVVLLNEVLEHVPDQEASLREIYRVLRPGGHLALMSPNRWFPFEGHGLRVRGRGLPFPVPLVPWLPQKLTLRFMEARNYWPGELEGLVADAGFTVRFRGTVFPLIEQYGWLPAPLVRLYRRGIALLEHLFLVRNFGVSTFVVGQKPTA